MDLNVNQADLKRQIFFFPFLIIKIIQCLNIRDLAALTLEFLYYVMNYLQWIELGWLPHAHQTHNSLFINRIRGKIEHKSLWIAIRKGVSVVRVQGVIGTN